MYLVCPSQLHQGLAQAAISKYSGAAFGQGPVDDIALEVEQGIRQGIHRYLETVIIRRAFLFSNKHFIIILSCIQL